MLRFLYIYIICLLKTGLSNFLDYLKMPVLWEEGIFFYLAITLFSLLKMSITMLFNHLILRFFQEHLI